MAESLILHLLYELVPYDRRAPPPPDDERGRCGRWERVLTAGVWRSSDLLPGPVDSFVRLSSAQMRVSERVLRLTVPLDPVSEDCDSVSLLPPPFLLLAR